MQLTVKLAGHNVTGKISFRSLEAGDVASFQENLDAMFSILNEDKDAKIRQDIADGRLKSANTE